MNLEYALETLNVELRRVCETISKAERAEKYEFATHQIGVAAGLRYAIDVLEAAMGGSK